MKRLVVLLLLLTPWAMRSMEPEEKAVELKQETVAQDRPSWVRLVEEVLPGDIPHSSSTNISQVIAQEILQKKPQIRQFIFDTISLPFKDFECHSRSTNSSIKFNSTGDKIVVVSRQYYSRGVGKGNLYIDWTHLYEVKSGKLILTLKADSVESNPTGDEILLFSSSGTVARIWDSKTDEFIPLKGHTDGICSAAFNRAGDKVATGSRDGTAKIWEVKTGKLLHTLKHDIVGPVVFNWAGDQVATGSRKGTAKIWNLETGTLLHTLKGRISDPLLGELQLALLRVGFNATGNKLVITTNNTKQYIRIWDVATEKALLTQRGSAWLSPAGDKVAIEFDDSIAIWGETGRLPQLLSHIILGRFCKFAPAGDKVVTLRHNKAIIWDVETGEKCHSLKHEYIAKVVFSPAGDKVLTIQSGAYVSKGDRVRIWDVKTGKLLHILRDDHDCLSATFNPAGDKVAVHFGDKVRMFDLEPLFKSLKFLIDGITHRQVAILNDIYEVIRAQASVKAGREKTLQDAPLLISPEDITFDFNRYPQTIWDEYNAIPEAIRKIFDPYIIKLSSSREEQAPIEP